MLILLLLFYTVLASATALPGDATSPVKHFAGRIEQIDRFNKWFEKHYNADNVKPLKVKVAPAGTSDMRMGVYATEKITQEEIYLRIPLKIVISAWNIFPDGEIGKFLKRHYKDDIQQVLLLYLMFERFANSQSFWKPYIDLLPTKHDTPLFFTDDELKLLQGTGYADKVSVERYRYRKQYEAARNTIMKHVPDDTWPTETLTWQNFIWAVGILNTRMIWWDFEPHLVPMLDMINCVEGPSNPDRVHQTKRDERFAVTRAPWTFRQGDEVFENYGQNNPYYFYSHGFVLQPNTHDCANIRLPRPKTDLLSALASRYDLFREEYCVGPSFDKMGGIMPSLRAAMMTTKQLKKYADPAIPLIDLHVSFDPENNRKAFGYLVDTCNAQLERYETTPGEDETLLNDGKGTLSFRVEQSILYRLTQKKLLFQVVRWADKFAHKKA